MQKTDRTGKPSVLLSVSRTAAANVSILTVLFLLYCGEKSWINLSLRRRNSKIWRRISPLCFNPIPRLIWVLLPWMFPHFLIETQIVSFLSSFPMRECPLLVSDNAVRDQLKRVKTLKKNKNKKTKTKTVRQTNRKNVIKIQIYKFSLYFLCLFSFFSLAGRELAWRFVEDNWDELYTRYAGGLLFSRLIKVTFVIEKLHGRKLVLLVEWIKPLASLG